MSSSESRDIVLVGYNKKRKKKRKKKEATIHKERWSDSIVYRSEHPLRFYDVVL